MLLPTDTTSTIAGPANEPSPRGRTESEAPQGALGRRLMAIMFSDMVGYTALMAEDERRAKLSRDRQRLVLEDAVARHGGRIVEFVGDGTLSVFESAVRAVQCSVEVLSTLGRGSSVPLRIGIHTGDVTFDGAGVYGDAVNVASRIQELAPPGGVLISDKVHDEVKNQPSLRTRSLGSFHLKHLLREVPVHAAVTEHQDIASGFGRPRAGGEQRETIAVLPFASISADTADELFCDGLVEEVAQALTQLGHLRVAARTSAFAFKGDKQDVRDIGERLGAGLVLEGSVRRAGDRLRVRAQLIDGRDGHHLLSMTYDGTLGDALSTQIELARAIVDDLCQQIWSRSSDQGPDGRSLGQLGRPRLALA